MSMYERIRRFRFDDNQLYFKSLPLQPCIGCEHVRECSERLLACRGFYNWVNYGKPEGKSLRHGGIGENPTRAWYLKALNTVDNPSTKPKR